MVQLTAVDAQKPCWFYHVKVLQQASSRFTTIFMETTQISDKGDKSPASGGSLNLFLMVKRFIAQYNVD